MLVNVQLCSFPSFRPTLPFICLPWVPHGCSPSVSAARPWRRAAHSQGPALWRNSEGGLFFHWGSRRGGEWRHSVLQTDSLCLSFFVCSDTARTPGGGTGSLTSPGFHHRFPKHPWNASSWKTPFHPESPAVPHAPTAQDLLTPSGKTEIVRLVGIFFFYAPAFAPKGFAHSARTQRRRLTLWMGSVGYHYTPLRRTSKTSSFAPLEVGARRFFSEYDSLTDRITWRQRNATVQKSIVCWKAVEHSVWALAPGLEAVL